MLTELRDWLGCRGYNPLPPLSNLSCFEWRNNIFRKIVLPLLRNSCNFCYYQSLMSSSFRFLQHITISAMCFEKRVFRFPDRSSFNRLGWKRSQITSLKRKQNLTVQYIEIMKVQLQFVTLTKAASERPVHAKLSSTKLVHLPRMATSPRWLSPMVIPYNDKDCEFGHSSLDSGVGKSWNLSTNSKLNLLGYFVTINSEAY